ncbi:hypothetical protein A33Q_3361 [Indibacter alkaliphilus LW1]|uniref:Uncharacterized protein n=1 Tax=Indibacter alkaliphilus (strain CCUG 57479 / KCTC 22604 / LW1) TaxID=1189612 RepID=S2DSX1_INDAL|nr:hypothetical protein A33Q_3361 [Indibacter alkaliphilus LW1]
MSFTWFQIGTLKVHFPNKVSLSKALKKHPSFSGKDVPQNTS